MKSSVFKFVLLFVVSLILAYSSDSSATEFRIAIDSAIGRQSDFTEIAIRNLADANDSTLANGKSVGSFSFLISYDTECLRFVEARKGSMLVDQNWGFFNVQSQINGTLGLIHIMAIADTNRSDSLPGLPQSNQGEWAVLKFWVTDNCYFQCSVCPISWYWFDCQNNIISDSTKTATWVADTLLNWLGYPIDLKTFFSTDVSRCDTILEGTSKRFTTFINGSVDLPCDGCFSDRGDLNLNGLKNEMADYILYQDYFLHGGSVFSSNPQRRQGQIAASDVNDDSLTLRVSDLVYMASILTGDAYPLPKSTNSTSVDSAHFQIVRGLNHLTVWSNSTADISGVFLHLTFSGTADIPIKSTSARNLDLAYTDSTNELRLLLSPPLAAPYDSSKISAGNWPIISIPFVGDLQKIQMQASNRDGQELASAVSLIQTRGDLNGDRNISPADVVSELKCVFVTSNCSLDLADINCDGSLTVADVVGILNAAFLGEELSCP